MYPPFLVDLLVCIFMDSKLYRTLLLMQVVCNSKSSFLAAADDGGDVKVCLLMSE